MILVKQWPTSINTDVGIICNPSPEQCRANGYELEPEKTVEQINAENAAAEQAESERLAIIEKLRNQYRDDVHSFCVLAGLQVVNKFEDETAIAQAIEAANNSGNIALSLGLTQLALRIEHGINELRRKDGDDAWERL